MPMSREDFLQWRGDPVTQWVMRRLREQAEAHRRSLAQQALSLSQLDPLEWAARQPSLASAIAHVDRIFWFADDMNFDELKEEADEPERHPTD